MVNNILFSLLKDRKGSGLNRNGDFVLMLGSKGVELVGYIAMFEWCGLVSTSVLMWS